MEPMVSTIELKVYGNMNNLSVATAIYNWYADYVGIYDDGYNLEVDLETVIKMLQAQVEHDRSLD